MNEANGIYYTVVQVELPFSDHGDFGPVTVTSDGKSITGVWMATSRGVAVDPADTDSRSNHHAVLSPDLPILAEAGRQLTAYFARQLKQFDLPLAPEGTTFQLGVWEELTRIPYGTTISYSELARRIGNPAASRAVGLANGKNPISIVVPCHRVIGASGNLTGFGGGIQRKAALLTLESPETTLHF